MGKLPFVVEPRFQPVKEVLGSDISGKIEIERRGYLSVGEKAFVNNGSAGESLTSSMLSIVRAVAAEEKLDMQEAYEVVQKILTGEEHKLSGRVEKKHKDEINALGAALMASEERKTFLQAFCMLLYRVNSDITTEDAMSLHPDLIGDLSKFYREEEAKTIERLIKDEEVKVDEDMAGDIEKK